MVFDTKVLTFRASIATMNIVTVFRDDNFRQSFQGWSMPEIQLCKTA